MIFVFRAMLTYDGEIVDLKIDIDVVSRLIDIERVIFAMFDRRSHLGFRINRHWRYHDYLGMDIFG